ncbi:MAG: DUF2851 family protein [FCB group bacterium]|nr:DUF2851 family protein [FCB group bacterium]MBL7028466.1 DUF2851 family protein [Candidatus Neomarinimicrobiota bacterium]MBL7121530.1 DUF2851 family protein [Candidatus Neomarinimicrobiota bacterium]
MVYYEENLQQYAIAEGNRFNWYAKEKDLVAWWLRRAELSDNLCTVDGERLTVLDSGQCNHGPGPDIFRSRILLDDFEMSGAVEMHLKAGDWFVHGHQCDVRYHDVILHVVLEGDTGPDIPTLKVDKNHLGAGECLAKRQITPEELVAHAFFRFKKKQEHLKLLAKEGQEYSPLFLGMIEIIMAGGSRFKQLHQAAQVLGLNHWPDCRTWQGSNLSYPDGSSKALLLKKIMEASHIFCLEDWYTLPQDSMSDVFMEMRSFGLSLNQCREWLVNILAPFIGDDGGFEHWLGMKIFRHYGLEKKMLPRLGLSKIRVVVEQQGLLAWRKNYCRTQSCSNCPLTQYHHTLTHIN